jgi:uncharacterized membrane protein YhdT
MAKKQFATLMGYTSQDHHDYLGSLLHVYKQHTRKAFARFQDLHLVHTSNVLPVYNYFNTCSLLHVYKQHTRKASTRFQDLHLVYIVLWLVANYFTYTVRPITLSHCSTRCLVALALLHLRRASGHII